MEFYEFSKTIAHFEDAVDAVAVNQRHSPIKREPDLGEDIRATYHRIKELEKATKDIHIAVEQSEDNLWIGVYFPQKRLAIFYNIWKDAREGRHQRVLTTSTALGERLQKLLGEPTYKREFADSSLVGGLYQRLTSIKPEEKRLTA